MGVQGVVDERRCTTPVQVVDDRGVRVAVDPSSSSDVCEPVVGLDDTVEAGGDHGVLARGEVLIEMSADLRGRSAQSRNAFMPAGVIARC